ncbi:MAG: hypothetical protein K0R55_4654 [Sporomusa sp.]|jgi:hypothetical protein|nr:hypothetical protein [Sporomusa sp.]
MQEMKPDPIIPVDANSPVSQKTPGFSLLNQLHNLFLRKADLKFAEAQQLLNQQTYDQATIADSLDTGKLNKLINYIKTGTPSLVLMFSVYSSQAF